MALTATATQGLEFYREVVRNELLYVPGDPGDTFTRGDAVVSTVGEGVVDPAATTEATIATVAKTVTMAAATTAAPFDTSNTLVPCISQVPEGTPIYLCTFASQIDEAVLGYTAGTPSFAGTTGGAGDDYPNGAIVYCYEGPGVGEVNIVADYDHTGGAAELLYILHRQFATAMTTSSKCIVLAGEAAGSRGVGFFNRCELADANNLTVADGADNGKWVVYLDWRDAATHLNNLRLPVIPASSLFLA